MSDILKKWRFAPWIVPDFSFQQKKYTRITWLFLILYCFRVVIINDMLKFPTR